MYLLPLRWATAALALPALVVASIPTWSYSQRWEGSYTHPSGVIFRWRVVPAASGQSGDRGVQVQVENPTSVAFSARFITRGRLTSGAPAVTFGGVPEEAEYAFGIVPPHRTFVQWLPIRFVVPSQVVSSEVVPPNGDKDFKDLFYNIPSCRQHPCGYQQQVDDLGKSEGDYWDEIARARFEWLTTASLTADQRQIAERSRSEVIAGHRDYLSKNSRDLTADQARWYQGAIAFLESVQLGRGRATVTTDLTMGGRRPTNPIPHDSIAREIEFKTQAQREEEARVRAADDRLRREAEQARLEEARRLEEQARLRAVSEAGALLAQQQSVRSAQAAFVVNGVASALAKEHEPAGVNPWAEISKSGREFLSKWLPDAVAEKALDALGEGLPPGPIPRAVKAIVDAVLPEPEETEKTSIKTLIRDRVADAASDAITGWLYEQSVDLGAAKTGDQLTDQAERIVSAARLHNLGFGLKAYMQGVGEEGAKLPKAISDMLSRELP